MKYKHLLILFFAFALSSLSVKADDYTIPSSGATANSTALPIWMANYAYGSLTQQIYLASELTATGASAGNITALTFHYTAKTSTAAAMTRPIKIWLMETTKDTIVIDEVAWQSGLGFDGLAVFNHNGTNKGGTLVYTGNLSTESCSTSETKTVTIDLDSSFPWDGSKNIVLTVCDMSETSATISSTNLRFVLVATSKPRFAHNRWLSGNSDTRTSWFTNLSDLHGEVYGTTGSGLANQVKVHKYVNKLTFSITPAAVVIPAPTNLAASSITTSSATLSWNAAAGATGYNVRWGKSAGSLDHNQNNVAATSLDISGLDDGETYYFDVQTITAGGTSAWTSEVSFNTVAIVHEHNGISFSKWASTTSMPTSGNYYLNADVAYDFYEGGYLDLAGDLNLCLNGHTINLGIKSINVTNGHTMTLFDHVGGGKITGLVAGLDGDLTFKGVISVENGGTLVLREGEVENTKPADDPNFKSIAVANGGTLIISGEPVISGNDIDIFLPATIPAKVITIESDKPLTNSTPYKVYKMDGVITSGWANMSGEDPRDYFVSANPERVVCLNGSGEAELVAALALNENSSSNEDRIAAQRNQLVNVNLTRSTLTNASFNTICLPFSLNNAQLEEVFGAGYDLEEFVSSAIEGDELVLTFNKVTSLVALKPYLLQPANNVTNPVFAGVTIANDEHPLDQTSDDFISFHGVFNPTELTGGNKNLLFLGAGNELFWPASTGNIKGFRAYFEVKGAARQARAARIAKREGSATGVGEVQSDKVQGTKILRNGQLFIMYNGTMYDVMGRMME